MQNVENEWVRKDWRKFKREMKPLVKDFCYKIDSVVGTEDPLVSSIIFDDIWYHVEKRLIGSPEERQSAEYKFTQAVFGRASFEKFKKQLFKSMQNKEIRIKIWPGRYILWNKHLEFGEDTPNQDLWEKGYEFWPLSFFGKVIGINAKKRV